MKKASVYELLKLLSPYKLKIIFLVFIMIFTAGCNLLMPLVSKSIMDDGFMKADAVILRERVMEMFVLVLIIAVIDIVKDKIRIGIQTDLKLFLSQNAFHHLSRLPMNYFDTKNYGEIFNNLKADIQNVSMIADNSLFFVFAQIFSIIGGIVGLFILNFKLAFLVILLIPIKYFIARFFANRNRKLMESYIIAEQHYAKWFGDAISGIQEIKLFHLYQKKYEEFGMHQKEIMNYHKKTSILFSYNIGIEKIIMQLLLSAIYILGAIQVFNLESSIGSTFAFISYSAYVTAPITAIMSIKQMLSGIFPSVERYVDFMNVTEEKVSGKEVPTHNKIYFDKVSMTYGGGAGENAVDDISFQIKPFTKTAIIGRNGSGKSTIINIILRLYDYNEGKVTLSGTDIREFDLDQYRNLFSVVSQDICLFHDTIRNNICLYKDFSDDEIYFAIKVSGLEEMIEKNTLEYIVGERGTLLSGGEKQKISFARAVLHNKPILILDEATANTDIQSKKSMFQYLFETTNHKTIITITHSDEILKLVDHILLVDHGKIISLGKYDDLLKNKIAFQDMILDE